ncbi:Hypothetical protein KVN_LOCUS451 [uncultured virus]|nr:Hypothetical protein KVN_LOCUS451 [uncultured virus]
MDTNQSINIEQLKESFKLIVKALNSGCKAGIFTMDDSYLLKLATSNIEKTIKILEIKQSLKLEDDSSSIKINDSKI